MAQPTAYDRQYNFSGFQSSYPDTPLPAAQVDVEFDAVETTLDGVLTNLALIQRDDGEIKNASIGIDQLKTDTIALISANGVDVKGDWVTATAYVIGDLVEGSDGAVYICNTAHTSGTFTTDRDTNGYWTLYANPIRYLGTPYFEAFNGTGAQTAFTMSQSLEDEQQIMLFVDGDFVDYNDFSVSGTTLTITSPPPSGTRNVLVLGSDTSVQASASAAATSAANAATSETNAATSATNAATSATNAATSATNAAASETNAAASAASIPTVINAPTTYTIGSGGGDDYATLTAALAALDDMLLLDVVTLNVQAEVITEPGGITIDHPMSWLIDIQGSALTSTTISSISGAIVSNGSGDHEIEYNVADSTGFAANSYVIISGLSGTGRFENHCGVYQVISAGSNKVKVRNTNQKATFPGSTAVTGGNIEQFNSEIDLSSAAGSGITFDRCYGLKTGALLYKDATGNGLRLMNGSNVNMDAKVGVVGSGSNGVQVESGSTLMGQSTILGVSNNTNDGLSVFAQGAARFSEIVANGNAADGVQSSTGGMVYAGNDAQACGNGGYGVNATYGCNVYLYGLSADDNGIDGVSALNGSIVQCQSGTASGNVQRGYDAATNGYINADSCTADSNGNDGFQASQAGHIFADSSTSSNNGVNGYDVDDAGVITATSSTASGNTSNDYLAQRTGYIDATSATGTPSFSPAVNTAGNEEAYINQ